MKLGRSLVLTVLVCLGITSVALGQQSTVQGVVTDSSGAVILGATVTVTNLETGVDNTVTTNEGASPSRS